jgi:Zn-finger nucleic acid-binding protein
MNKEDVNELSKLIEKAIVTKMGATKKFTRIQKKWEAQKQQKEMEKSRKHEEQLKRNFFLYSLF